MATAPSFLSYTPVALTFGTSGLRGLVEDITDLEAYINVLGALRYLIAEGDIRGGSKIVLGGDLRPSTPRIMRASARAVLDAGCRVENAGCVPTPAILLHSLATRQAGVMVSGSHIPFDRNGIKINKSIGEVLKTDEPGIVREVEKVREQEYGRDADSSMFTPKGMLKSSTELGDVDKTAEDRFVRRYVEAFGAKRPLAMNVLVYEHSAVGRDLLGRILRELGATVIPAGRAETFIPIDTENVTPELLERLDALVVAAEATGGATPDVIVSTDGDSDRPFVAAVLPKGAAGSRIRFLPGDLLGLTVAELLGADAVAVPISSNDAVERRMTERAVHLEKTKIGSPYVVAALAQLTARGGYARVVGWEANGGFLLGSEVTLGAAPLAPLPTRDSILPILAALVAGQDAKLPLATLWERLPARFGASGLKDNVPVKVSRSIMQALVPPGEVTEVRFGKDSVVEPTVGGVLYPKEVEAWRDAARTLAKYFSNDLGFGDIERLNVLDGARAYFSNGDVAHVRPSGNAPQLRIYANADTRERADAIVAMGLREPDGILSSLTRAFG